MTKTGPGPQKTDKDQSWSVQSGLFGFYNKGELVPVLVLHFWAKRPDRTGLTNTTKVEFHRVETLRFIIRIFSLSSFSLMFH